CRCQLKPSRYPLRSPVIPSLATWCVFLLVATWCATLTRHFVVALPISTGSPRAPLSLSRAKDTVAHVWALPWRTAPRWTSLKRLAGTATRDCISTTGGRDLTTFVLQ